MVPNLLRGRGNPRRIDALNSAIVAAARRPALFLPPYSVPDTMESRFDLLLLLSILLLRRLEALPEPGPEAAQALVDRLFEYLDAGLREMGVGDLAVPKRMKKLAEAFAGRSAVYRAALAQDDETFAAALARNIYGLAVADEPVRALADYARRTIAALDQADFAEMLTRPPFPDPEATDAQRR